MCLTAPIISFLTPVFQSLIASAIFEAGKGCVSKLAGVKSMEKRYASAFERAICRYYADPKYAGNEARREYKEYLKALKNDYEGNGLFKEDSGLYKELLDLFKDEVYKDWRLQQWTRYRILVTSAHKLDQIANEQQTIINELIASRRENRQGFESVSRKLDEIVKSVASLRTLQNVEVIPSVLSKEKYADESNLHIIPRQELVQHCASIIRNGKVLVLYGGVKVGKGTLAELVIKDNPEGFVLRDVSSANLELAIRLCIHEKHEGKDPVITTEAPLDVNVVPIDSRLIEQVSVPLLTKEETIDLIHTYNPQKDYSKFIFAHSCGHPVLVRTLCTFLSTCNWIIDEDVFGKMLNYSFDFQLPRSLADLMQRMIPDAESRSLLNRMMLKKTSFTEEDVLALANVPPVINEPKSRLLVLQPSWVSEENGVFTVTPLYDKAWTPDMSPECYRNCNWLLASRILSKKEALNELDVLHFILYAQNAEHYDDAGLIFIQALSNVDPKDLTKLSILPSMWVDISLPKQMSENLRIAIRIKQLMTFDHLSSAKKDYLLKDLCSLVDNSQGGELTASYYGALSALCWTENQMQLGMHYYNLSLSTRNQGSKGLEEMKEMEELFKTGAWFLPLRFTSINEYHSWLDSIASHPFEYNHGDPKICECCYLSLFQLVNRVWEKRDVADILKDLQEILSKSLSDNCPEMAAATAFEMMEVYSKADRYNDARRVYDENYESLKSYPLAIVLLNGSRAFSIYADKERDNKDALPYIQTMKTPGYEDIIPNIHLHMRQIESYIVSETNIEDGISYMKDTIAYVQQPNHSSTPYEYYQCLGELSFLYWRAGNRKAAVEIVSECISYVTSNVGLESPFAKTYLCLCDCLLVFYLSELQEKELPKEQARPMTGMFTERGPQQLDELYSIDRIYTSSYLMCQICDELEIFHLKNEWAYKVLDAILRRGENKEIHYMVTLLIPEFLKRSDFDAVEQVSKISNDSQAKAFESHPELRRDSVDSEYVEFVIIPALIEALRIAITGDRRCIDRIRDILASYKPLTNSGVIEKVLSVLSRESYDSKYIEEIQVLDVNTFYPVYICTYLITTLSVDATQAFKLIMGIIVRLEGDLVKVMGSGGKEIINRFVSSFWRARVLTSPEEFRDYKHLASKGLELIEAYSGKANQANHTMMIVRDHLLQEVQLNDLQEKWLDE